MSNKINTKQSFQEFIGKTFKDNCAISNMPNEIYKKYHALLEKAIDEKDPKKRNKIAKELDVVAKEYGPMLFRKSYHTQVFRYMNDDETSTMAVDITEDLIEEYKCTTTSEIQLCELAAMSYCKYLRFTGRSMNLLSTEWLSADSNGYYSQLNKEANRAYKQYIDCLNTLRSWKSPKLKVNIKTDTAFIAEQQQLNNYENVKSN